MLRSLGLVLIGVVLLWFFGQASPGDAKTVRPVDTGDDVKAWTSTVAGGPVPTAPSRWVPTVSQFTPSPVGLRLGWNTPDKRYVEYAATTGPATPFLTSTTGGDHSEGTVEVAGHTWDRWVDDDGSVSLSRGYGGGVTVVVGTTRENAPQADLEALAASLPA